MSINGGNEDWKWPIHWHENVSSDKVWNKIKKVRRRIMKRLTKSKKVIIIIASLVLVVIIAVAVTRQINGQNILTGKRLSANNGNSASTLIQH